MLKITKWFEDKDPNEADIRGQMESEGLKVNILSEEAGTTYEPNPTNQIKSLVVIKGMTRITLPDLPEDFMDLMAGDRLDIPKGTNHGMMVGPAGVTIVEGKK